MKIFLMTDMQVGDFNGMISMYKTFSVSGKQMIANQENVFWGQYFKRNQSVGKGENKPCAITWLREEEILCGIERVKQKGYFPEIVNLGIG